MSYNKLKCRICGRIYKRHSGLAKHKKAIQDANTIKSTIYDLPERAIEETWQVLVYHIKEKLKHDMLEMFMLLLVVQKASFSVFLMDIYIIIIQKQEIISVSLKVLILTLLYHIY